jgi:hypothetical protein
MFGLIPFIVYHSYIRYYSRRALVLRERLNNAAFERNKLRAVDTMKNAKAEAIRQQIADLKANWPAHSVPPSMWQKLEELEEALEQAEKDPGAGQ